MGQAGQPFSFDSLTSFVTVIVALSIASERLVDMVKGAVPWLQSPLADAKSEGWRKAVLQLLATAAGITTAYMANLAGAISDLGNTGNSLGGIVVVGLLASGGSGFWNSILGYMSEVKKLKHADAKVAQARATG